MLGKKSFPPVYTRDDAQKASENLRQIIPLINKHKTPVNPVNYAVWYEYVSGENEQLKKTLDLQLHNKLPITTELTQTLYEKYVLFDMPDRLDSANKELSKIVNETLSHINKVETTATDCVSDLTETHNSLRNYSDIKELKAIISGILTNTETLTITSQNLKAELEKSSREIQLLKSELEAVKEISRIDGLTGLLNRRSFDQELERVCQQQSINTSIVMLDLDHFKKLNDNLGHLVGDKVLQFFSGLLIKHTGKQHIAARFGGEEMVMILFDQSKTETLDLAEKIRRELSDSRLKHKKDNIEIGQVTVSIGISFFEAGDTPNSFIDRADQALYLAKNNGRNQVQIN